MNAPKFFQTIMGRQFYEGTMPKLLEAVQGINRTLKNIDEKLEHLLPAENQSLRGVKATVTALGIIREGCEVCSGAGIADHGNGPECCRGCTKLLKWVMDASNVTKGDFHTNEEILAEHKTEVWRLQQHAKAKKG